jgi:hypothetical protein
MLINPPVAKPGEPPAGLARLCGALRAHGIGHTAADLNLEGLLYLMEKRAGAGRDCRDTADRWTARAEKNFARDLALVRSSRSLENFDSYKKAVLELERLASKSGGSPCIRPGLADYQDESLSPLKSSDLMRAAREHRSSPFFPHFSARIPGMMEGSPSCFAGISVNYLSQALPAFAIAGFIRENFPAARIILGGGLVTSWLSRPGWVSPFSGLIDRLVAGPGEGALLKLLGKETAQSAYRPDYSLFTPANYLSPGPVLPYSTAAGCWWRKCSFCPEKAEGSNYLPLAPDRALAEIEKLAELEKPSLIHFLDSALSPSFLKRIAESPPGIPWYGFARITDHLADPGFCRALRRSGCVMLKLGIESGDQRVLDKLNKGITLAQVEAALKSLREAGIATYVYLLFGTPPETPEAAHNTRDFVLRNAGGIEFLNLAIFNLPLDSEDGAGLKRRKFYEGDLSLYADFEHPSGWGRRQVRQFLDREFKREPAIAAILRRDPPLFTSNHAPFFTKGFRFP